MSRPLSERASGRWSELLPLLGVDRKYLTAKQGPCPLCNGRTRFRFDDLEGRGTWICNHCGPGDGPTLAIRVLGISFREVAERVDALIGTVPARPVRAKRSPDDCRERLNRLWRSSKPVQPGDPVARYLARRVGLATVPACLRTVRRLRYQDETPSWHPAMLAMVTGPDGAPATIHRTYLTEDGRKAPVEDPRRMMPGTIPAGAAIRLFDPGPVLGIAEGIETACAAASLFGIPCWAAINSTLLAKWEPPLNVDQVVIFGDTDAAYAGQAAAYALAHRLSRTFSSVRVEMPREVGRDWCDILADELAAA
ncbi:DUF7146 domain-containing protein [Methylobacterium platani]|uniref:p4 alpha zinc-binding domain protein n=2 Tax=Methylobacterium platani TaxID=427683 RepID=A0A179S8U2_9HYPH|nr:toprim domain-containing protein [Methylobacterium platani]KMO20641.1 P4 alpha zinc-binding domain protein [Methylobacterium platani JCM 14648]OAS22205.1 P4 alpha zinc-binding domain protein [Methylobacterium platani]